MLVTDTINGSGFVLSSADTPEMSALVLRIASADSSNIFYNENHSFSDIYPY